MYARVLCRGGIATDIKIRVLQDVSRNLQVLPKKIYLLVSSEATRLLVMLHDLGVSHVYHARSFLLREVIVFIPLFKTRFFVNTHEDSALSSMPTAEWQDRLAARLSRNISEGPRSTSAHGSPSRAFGGAPLPQRRRLDESSPGVDESHPNWNEMYTLEASSGNSIFSVMSKCTQLDIGCFRFSRDRRITVRNCIWTTIAGRESRGSVHLY